MTKIEYLYLASFRAFRQKCKYVCVCVCWWTLLWTHYISPSLLSSSRFQTMPNGSLVITDVTTDDTGRYTCVAGNSCSIKDRMAQLYVVGESNTHWRIYTGSLYQEQRSTQVADEALIKPLPSACRAFRPRLWHRRCHWGEGIGQTFYLIKPHSVAPCVLTDAENHSHTLAWVSHTNHFLPK